MYRLFPRLHARRDARGDALSGGEQQMLAIARALVQNPTLMLMDEPSEGLSPILVQEVGNIISHLHEQGVSILMVEQNLHFALGIAERILIMNKGAILFSGLPQELARNDQLCRQYLGVGVGSMAWERTHEYRIRADHRRFVRTRARRHHPWRPSPLVWRDECAREPPRLGACAAADWRREIASPSCSAMGPNCWNPCSESSRPV